MASFNFFMFANLLSSSFLIGLKSHPDHFRRMRLRNYDQPPTISQVATKIPQFGVKLIQVPKLPAWVEVPKSEVEDSGSSEVERS